MLTRRHLVAAAAAATAATAKPFSHPIGLNLFTVRTPLGKAPAETYRGIAAAGVTVLEVRPPNLQQHASMMRDAGLRPVHMFIESAIVTGAWDEWQAFMSRMAARYKAAAPRPAARKPTLAEMIDLAKAHGVQRLGISMLLPGERDGAIVQLNRAAEQCAAAGLEFYYHNHAYEFAGARGSRYLDRLRKELDPRVRLELDVFWASLGGDAPDAVLKQWKGRVRSVHFKDVAADAPKAFTTETDIPPTAFRELGQGTLNWPAILRAARAAGVEHYFVEMDFTPGEPLESVRRCVQYLRGVNL